MASAHDEFFVWLRGAIERGVLVLQTAFDRSPRDHFEASTVNQLYGAIDEWSAYRVGMIARLRRQLAEPEHLVSYFEDRFSTDRFLVFFMRFARDSDRVIEIDLTNRDHFLDVAGFVEMRELMLHAREEPSWRTVQQNIANDLRTFERLVEGLRSELVFVGEPRAATLSEALTRLSAIPYLDHLAIKAASVTAETHFRNGQGKSGAAMLRPAVELVIKDAYQEGLARHVIPPAAGLPDLRSQAEALGRSHAGAAPFLERSIATFAYGTFALLSGLGSHAGPIEDVAAEQAWSAGVAALTMLGERLPA